MELGGEGRGTQLRVPTPSHQSPASEGEEEELLMEEEEEEVLAGVSAEDKNRRPPAKVPSEPAHPGEGRGRQGEQQAELGCRRRLGTGQAFLFLNATKMSG